MVINLPIQANSIILAEYAIMADGSEEEDLDMTSGYCGIDLLQD
jgi:hypothetical protein